MEIPRHFRLFLLGLVMVGAAAGFLAGPVAAQKGNAPIIIRDTEIENTLKEWARPLFKAANIDPNGIDIVLIQSPQINAFVAGGANIFIYTGLIEKTKNPEELIGVMAHELGHIEGGHLIATRRAFERASYESIVGTVVGIGAAILSGQGEAASAIISGSQNIAGRRFLSHTRVNESAADQAALRYMQQGEINPAGLVSFFRVLESQELLPTDQQTEYMRTHPLTRNRIDAVENSAKSSPYYGQATPQKWQDDHARIKAKLMGFINPAAVPWTYDDRDHSIVARYARAIAAYKTNKVDESLTLMDELLADEPDNPYFLELKAQMLVDYGRLEPAIPLYRRSVSLLDKNTGLIRTSLGHALLESGDDSNVDEAITVLKAALVDEQRSPRIHRLLATAYGRKGDEIDAKLNLAEEAVLQGRYDYAKAQAEFVVENASAGSREAIQAQDIVSYIEQVDTKQK